MPNKRVSGVIPVYNEAELLPELTRRIKSVLAENPNYDWEVIYVNDGSSDGSAPVLSECVTGNPWLSVLHLSRNFGHQTAISAGTDYASGEAVVVMDGDLQDPPELLSQMLALWEEGYEVVYATRKHRQGETPFKLLTAKLFYRLLQRFSDVPIPLDTGDFRLMDRKVVNALSQMREKNRFIRGMVSWVGFKQTPLYYERDERKTGKTKYTLSKMIRFAVDGMLSFSTVPLQLITTLGFIISAISFILVVVVVYMKLFTNIHVETGWPTIMIGILMLGGIQLVCLGFIGEYVGRIFDEVRQRPLYLVRQIETQRHQGLEYLTHPLPRELEIFEYSPQ